MAIRISTEAKLLDAAEELFFTRGIAATPVDAVLERAGVSAATLYRGYAGKDALVAAALERRHRLWLEAWDAAVGAQSTPQGRLLAVFDALDAFRTRPVGARWCAFLASAAEYPDAPDDVRSALERDSDTMRERLTALAGELGQGSPGELAAELMLVITGDLAMRLRDPAHDTGTARRVAARLIAP
jgi:AcrR family transcriptional regulator